MPAIPFTASDRKVRFAASNTVHEVPRKTEAEAKTLFYQPAEVDRFRLEARWEKLAKATQFKACTGADKLNAMTQLARHQFRIAPCQSRTSGAKGCARIA